MVVIWILAALFLALIILVPLVERFGPRMSDENLGKVSKWVLPLMAVLLVLQLLWFVI